MGGLFLFVIAALSEETEDFVGVVTGYKLGATLDSEIDSHSITHTGASPTANAVLLFHRVKLIGLCHYLSVLAKHTYAIAVWV